jgi:multisubunit Na+/H+ antiporter MnhG subunit
MPGDRRQPTRSATRHAAARAKYLGLGSACFALAIVAGATASWVPLAILIVIGLALIARGAAVKRA